MLCAISSCASKQVSSDTPSLPVSEASLLSDAEGKESTDASAFSGLQPGASGATEVSDGTFYNALGGESLGRVAITLYSDKSWKKKLGEKNAELAGQSKLSAGQKVYFDFDGVKPQPTYLTKDLLDRYGSELSQKIKENSSVQAASNNNVTVQAGETLQKISQRLYGSTRYWPELYLLNRDKISQYDKVPAGTTLVALEHSAITPSSSQAAAAGTISNEAMNAPSQPAPANEVNSQATEAPSMPASDPIPETPEASPAPVVNSAPPAPMPAAVAEPAPAAPAPMTAKSLIEDNESNNANLRRILYVALIVAIGGLAFYFTRPSKKQRIDMLDVTTGASAPRSKLPSAPGKDGSRKSIG